MNIHIGRKSLMTVLLVFLFLSVAWGDTPLDIGSRLELFVDNYLIENMNGLNLTLHHPVPVGPAIRFDKPWEGEFVGYCTVIEDNGKYRLYYRGYPDATKEQVTCYAESRDGITFTKPNLGICNIGGSTANNVILADVGPETHNFSPFLDTKPGIPPEQRYKAVGGSAKSGLLAYVSPDGIHWKKLREEPIITEGAFDSQNVVFWSENEKCYLSYFRIFAETGSGKMRSISRTTSKDFLNWTKPQEMDYGGTPREHLYTNQTHPYFRAPHIYLSFPMRFMPGRRVMTEEQGKQFKVVGKYTNDCADVVFMSSRGGYCYSRTFMEGFIRPGLDPGNWASRSAMIALNVVPTGPNELSIYKQMHYAQPSAYIERYTLRTDGFVSVHAPYAGGEMITKPLIFKGSKMVMNFATSAIGYVLVEIQDRSGKAVPGFSIDDAVETVGDDIERVITWTKGTDVSTLAGKTVRLRFVMKDADIYSIRFR